MKTLYLVRHCSATGQAPEAELTETGHQQAQQLATFFEGIEIEHIFSSPFKRAQHSINPTALVKNMTVLIDERLAERTLSTTVFPNWLELLEQTFVDMDLKLTGGESSREATARAMDVLNEAPTNSILVSHGNLISLLLKHIDDSYGFNEWKTLSNPDVYQITLSAEGNSFKRTWN